MKSLIICLTAFMMCLGQTATAKDPSKKGRQGSTVTSTIRVRIPAFASLTLAQNKSSFVPVRDAALATSVKKTNDSSALQSNTNWMLNVDRIIGEASNKLGYSKSATPQSPVISLVYTATPQ